jgi:hypothetical protein
LGFQSLNIRFGDARLVTLQPPSQPPKDDLIDDHYQRSPARRVNASAGCLMAVTGRDGDIPSNPEQ